MKKIFTLLFILFSLVSFSQSTTLVVSQVYGAGGNTGAVLNADYVELHNVSGSPINLSGYTIQYASAAATGTWTGVSPLPAVSVPAGGYFLIQMSTIGANGAALPTVDYVASPSIAMAAAAGRIALVNGLVALSACPATGSYVDLVGYGTATCFEGAAPTAAISTTLAAFRNNNGCTDTDNNGSDFSVLTPAPRNGASPIFACTAIAPSLTVTGTLTDFGNVFIGSNSVSQSYNLSGDNLTGAPGNITVTSPSANFQVSNDNVIWGVSTTIAYSAATLPATAVWVRFTPQTAGFLSGNVTNAGGGAAVTVNVPVSGTGVTPAIPVLSATTLTAFGNVCLNSTVGPNNFTVNGINLTAADITIGPLTGFSFSTTSGGTYLPTLTLTQPGGTFMQQIFVNFTPVANQSYDGNINISGGGATSINVAASGSGANNPPSVTSGAASAITTTTANLAGSITGTGCSAITVYGIEYSLTNGFPNGAGTMVVSTNLTAGNFSSNLSGLSPTTTYYYKAYATNTGGTTYGLQRSFTTASPVITATPLTDFGSVCINTTTAENTFTIISTGITAANIVVGPLTGFSFSTTATGTYTASLNLTQPGGAYSQAIFVKFTPIAVQSYSGNIPVSGGGAIAISVAVTGSGINTAPAVVTGTSTVISPNIATMMGSVTDNGCSSVTEYGIVYSGIRGFAGFRGKKAAGSNISGTDYSVTLNNLIQATKYYYRAFATNNGGTVYGTLDSITTTPIPSGLIVYSSPIIRGGNVHYSLNNVEPGHYQTKIIDHVGRLVFQKEIILQLNFIDDNFILPGNIGPGIYIMEVYNEKTSVKKPFMVR